LVGLSNARAHNSVEPLSNIVANIETIAIVFDRALNMRKVDVSRGRETLSG